MASTDTTRGELAISIPWDEVDTETQRVIKAYRKKARIPGFRPGKAPESVIRARFGSDIRQEVLESLAPKHFWKEAQAEDYHVIGTPGLRDVKQEDGEPLSFTAEFEMIPDFELQDYRRMKVPYQEPEVEQGEIDGEIERLRQQHASFRNLDPRPLEDGDTAVVALKSLEVEGAPQIDQSETTIVIGSEETLEDFSTALRGKSPGDALEFEVNYPDDFSNEELAGKAVPFEGQVNGIRVKELPELDDDFAADVGDFRTLDELTERIREEIATQKRRQARERAHENILDQLIAMHEFDVPERLVSEQIRTRLERTARSLASQGVNLEEIELDWAKLAEEQKPRALRDVKAGLLLERVAEAEAIEAEEDEIESQVEAYARSNQTSASKARKQLSEDGTLDRIRTSLTNEKTLEYLFDEAEKVDPPEEEPQEDTVEKAEGETAAGEAGTESAEAAAVDAEDESVEAESVEAESTEESKE